jgi:UDP-glucose:(glucosyl)LPS alpha-1,2-glucosyltransferase
MSCIYKGNIVDTNLSRNARGGTEMMRERLLKSVPQELLQDFAIHFSRPREMYSDVKNILYCHDLALDPENEILKEEGWKKFDHFVFVSQWQRDQYILVYGIPYRMCTVIHNAVEKEYTPKDRDMETIRFIYHTTPHRGLQLVVPIFQQLAKTYTNIHLDVYSSFKVYGWEQRDKPYEETFEVIRNHPNMTYHGAVSNQEVLDALDRSHIFMYPCIWQETSCIALIEAIKSGLICVHPNYGALTETAEGATIVYDYTDDPSHHAGRCYGAVKNILETIREHPNSFNAFTRSSKFGLDKNSINTYTRYWAELLTGMRNE